MKVTKGNVPTITEILRRQLKPTLQMLSNAIRTCPDEIWGATDENAPLWQQAYHTLFWLNAWLRDWGQKLEYPYFHTREALDMTRGASPVITRAQIEEYMDKVFSDCEAFLEAITPESLTQETEAFGKKWTVADRILMQIRHVQHHVGSMHSVLRRKAGTAPQWIGFNE